ncbi:unnamed protein product [Adineta steineri]|uniref:Uncharacterized protein n=1 Tax=Adineta steineri TaxID=433720 RepID=A0A814Y325_9BILA|nr:unnamed protein product [Adineta steineri]
MDAYGMKCFEKYLKRCVSSTTPHVVDICYIRNNNYKSDIYQLILSVNQKPPKSMLEFESMLDKLNATGEITEVIDNKMFELHYPLQQQLVLDYYKYVLHADANVLSCLMGELVWHLYWVILQFEMKSKTLTDIQKQCKNILQQDKTTDEKRNERIHTYLNWLEQQRIERLKL